MPKKTNKSSPIVIQSNEFVQHAASDFTLNQLRVLYLLMSCIDRKDDAFLPIQVDYRTLYCVTDSRHSRSVQVGRREYLASMVKDMVGQSYVFYDESNKKTKVFPWFGFVELDDDDLRGSIVFKFNDCLTEHLLKLDRSFSKFQLGTILSFSSVYSIKLYNLFSSHAYKQAPVVYSLDTLRAILSLVNRKKKINLYEQPKEFVRRVLKPAIEEINEKSDLDVSYEIVKDPNDGRKTFGFMFNIQKKEVFVQENPLPPISVTDVELPKYGVCRKCQIEK